MIIEWTPQAKECLAVQYNCYRCSLGAIGISKPRCRVHHVVKYMVLNGKLPSDDRVIRLSKLLGKIVDDLKKLPLDVVAEKHGKKADDLLRAITAWANGRNLSKREALELLKLPVKRFNAEWVGR